MLFVIDTSSLIVLKTLGWLNLCRSGDNEFIWPASVTQELRERKDDNKLILDLLASGDSREERVYKFINVGEISGTDAEVISLAAECNAFIVSEDKPLRKKAARLRLTALSVATLVTMLYQDGQCAKEECLARLRRLYDDEFLSKTEYHQILQGILP